VREKDIEGSRVNNLQREQRWELTKEGNVRREHLNVCRRRRKQPSRRERCKVGGFRSNLATARTILPKNWKRQGNGVKRKKEGCVEDKRTEITNVAEDQAAQKFVTVDKAKTPLPDRKVLTRLN